MSDIKKFAEGKEFTVSEVIDSFGINGHTWLIFVLLGIANIFDGYDFMIVNTTNTFVANSFWPGADATQISALKGSLSTWGLLGMVLGGAFGGAMSDRMGRKKMLVFAVLFYGVFTLPQAFSQNLPFFAAFRLIAGFGVGSCLPVVTTCFSETIPSKSRAIFVTFGMAFMVAGWCLAGLVGNPISNTVDPIIPGLCEQITVNGNVIHANWRVCYLIGAIPIIYGLILIPTMHETPHWFANQGRKEDACKALEGIEQRTTGSHHDYDPALLVVPPKPAKSSPATLFSKKFIVGTAAVWTTYFVGQFCVYGMNAWIPAWFQGVGYSAADSVNLQTWNNFAAILSNVSCGFVSAKIGHKKNLAGAWILCIVAIVLCSVFVQYDPENSKMVLYVILMLLFGFALNYAITCVQPMMPEAYPTALRNTGVAWCQAFARFGGSGSSIVLGAFATNAAFMHLDPAGSGEMVSNWSMVVLVLIVPFVLGFICTLLFVRDSGGKSLEELTAGPVDEKDTGAVPFGIMMVIAAFLAIICIVCPVAVSGFSKTAAAMPLMTIGMILPFIFFFVFAGPAAAKKSE